MSIYILHAWINSSRWKNPRLDQNYDLYNECLIYIFCGSYKYMISNTYQLRVPPPGGVHARVSICRRRARPAPNPRGWTRRDGGSGGIQTSQINLWQVINHFVWFSRRALTQNTWDGCRGGGGGFEPFLVAKQ